MFHGVRYMQPIDREGEVKKKRVKKKKSKTHQYSMNEPKTDEKEMMPSDWPAAVVIIPWAPPHTLKSRGSSPKGMFPARRRLRPFARPG